MLRPRASLTSLTLPATGRGSSMTAAVYAGITWEWQGSGPGVRSAGYLRPVGGGTAALPFLNYSRDCFGSGKARDLGGSTSVSDYQLTALHAPAQ